MDGITFSLVPVADEISPNRKVYRAIVKTNGTVDKEDAEFDPKRNTLYVGATLAQELRDRVAGIAPDFAGDTSAGTVKLHSCMDLETQVFKVIRGTKSFRLAGANLTVPDGADESLALYAKDGVDKVADIEVSETDGGQRITCHLSDAAAIPAGTYKVRLASHGLDPTDPLTVATLTVTLVEAIPAPTPTKRVTIDVLQADSSTGSIELGGGNLDAIKGATWDSGNLDTFPAMVKIGDAPAEERTFTCSTPENARLSLEPGSFASGDAVTVTVTVEAW